jgi:hypothetical protein
MAALGGYITSVEADRVSMAGALSVTSGIGYSVHEIRTTTGMVIHEYMSDQGNVFAVSWCGPGLPDTTQLLRGYSTQLAQAATRADSHYNHHHVNIETPDVVMHLGGYLRTRFGYAWAPALLPHGFSVSQIQ